MGLNIGDNNILNSRGAQPTHAKIVEALHSQMGM